METLLAHNSQSNAGTEKSEKPLKIYRCVHLRIAEFFEKYFYTPIIMLGGIDMSHDGSVAVHELIEPHLGVNVGGAIHIIA